MASETYKFQLLKLKTIKLKALENLLKMKVVALISGGKDSCYNMIECVRNGHEIVALANLKPNIEGEIDSWMYQSVAQVSFITILLIIKILYEFYSF